MDCDGVPYVTPTAIQTEWILWRFFYDKFKEKLVPRMTFYPLVASFFDLLLSLIYFNLRLITLQNCGGFCQALTWTAFTYLSLIDLFVYFEFIIAETIKKYFPSVNSILGEHYGF